jgi:hypothetical protein
MPTYRSNVGFMREHPRSADYRSAVQQVYIAAKILYGWHSFDVSGQPFDPSKWTPKNLRVVSSVFVAHQAGPRERPRRHKWRRHGHKVNRWWQHTSKAYLLLQSSITLRLFANSSGTAKEESTCSGRVETSITSVRQQASQYIRPPVPNQMRNRALKRRSGLSSPMTGKRIFDDRICVHLSLLLVVLLQNKVSPKFSIVEFHGPRRA